MLPWVMVVCLSIAVALLLVLSWPIVRFMFKMTFGDNSFSVLVFLLAIAFLGIGLAIMCLGIYLR